MRVKVAPINPMTNDKRALMPILLRLANLGARHPGVTEALGDAYTEAASVFLSCHHESPIDVEAEYRAEGTECVLPWDAPTIPVLRAHANVTDATKQGACAVSFAAVEALAGLSPFAVPKRSLGRITTSRQSVLILTTWRRACAWRSLVSMRATSLRFTRASGKSFVKQKMGAAIFQPWRPSLVFARS
jgi:hypothetical protein